jgi:hypothetical protein
MSKGEYPIPDDLNDLFHYPDLKALADYLLDPTNKITRAIIITRDENNEIHTDGTKELGLIEAVGMIEYAKLMQFRESE